MLFQDRNEHLVKELKLQEHKDVLRKKFADKAIAFNNQLIEIKVFLTEKNTTGALEAQLKNITDKIVDLQKKSIELKELEDLTVELEKAVILDNKFTDLTAAGLAQVVASLEQLSKTLAHNVEQQIAASKNSGVDEKEIKEWKETFDHFDQDHSQSLDYKEFKSCLRAIGYDLTFAEDGAKDEQFDAIVSIVDPNHDGQIKWDEFLAFMILKSTTKVESSEGIADALQMISEGKPYVTTEQLRYYRYKRMYFFILFYFVGLFSRPPRSSTAKRSSSRSRARPTSTALPSLLPWYTI